MAAGLNSYCNVLAPDLRGRGLSSKPKTGYTMADHAQDLLCLLDSRGIKKAIIGGHSFGAFLSVYFANHFPERVEKLLILDAAIEMHPNTKEMLGNALGRLGTVYPSFDAYLATVKKAPYLDQWEEAMTSYYQADVQENADGTVTQRSSLEVILQAIAGLTSEPWLEYFQNLQVPSLLINATGVYAMNAPLLPKENALKTAALIKGCQYVEVAGNHQTMVYGQGAQEIVNTIKTFIQPREV